MPRFEKSTPKGIEFIDLRISGATVRTETGRIGGKAKPKRKQTKYTSKRAAESRFMTALQSAHKKGFTHVSKLRAPVENLALERTIAERPDDDQARAVYGDWLLEQGDPRGDLIALQRAKATPATKRKLTALLADHSSTFYGTLDQLLHVDDGRRAVRVEWKLGFFDEVELRLSEGGMPWYPKLSEAVAELAKLQSARFLRSLVLGGSAQNTGPAFEAVAQLPRTLRSLVHTGQLWGEYTPDEKLGDITPVCEAHPQLEVLKLRMHKEANLDGLLLPNLRELELWTNQLQPSQLQQVARGSWPQLRTWTIAIGGHGSARPDDFDAPLAKLPALATLRLGAVPDQDYARALAAKVVARGLRDVVLVNTDSDVEKAFRAAATGVKVTTAERET